MRLNLKLLLIFLVPLFLAFPLSACAGLPEAQIVASKTSGQAPLSVTFTNESKNADQFQWDFGDGATMTTTDVKESVTHEYTKAGTHTVTFTAGKPPKTSIATLTVTVQPGPLHEVLISPSGAKILPRQQLQFQATALDAFGNEIEGLQLSWEAGRAGTIDAHGLFTAGLVPGRYLKDIKITATAIGRQVVGTTAIDIPFSGFGMPTIDGVIGLNEWANASHLDFTVNVPGGGTAPATLFVMNDDTNLYLAVRVTIDRLYGTSLAFEFDQDRDGQRDVGIMLNDPNTFIDHMNGLLDVDLGGTNDGVGRVTNDGTFTMYELSCPLDSADDKNDFNLAAGDSIRFKISLRMIRVPSEWPRDFGDTDFPPGWWMEIVIAK
jgi:PKD repeat protein